MVDSISSQEERVECAICNRSFTRRGIRRHIQSAHPETQSTDGHDVVTTSSLPNNTSIPDYIQEKFVAGFGDRLLNTPGTSSVWEIRWWRSTRLNGKQYDLPQGAVGRQFTSLLAEEIQAVAEGSRYSEVIFLLCATVLQREKSVKAGADVRRMLCKRMEMW
ncbi:hypothetical protein GE061_017209 [Apolygus lucorum]|uniref:C2H2-type domain-containing protein n=1 Tax=Apolygus lucorum TaxID=248454 RepID=A0A8S9XEG2_APOLU|nr:hypothetical protein GE061_017209 [Apolygus lucorum]